MSQRMKLYLVHLPRLVFAVAWCTLSTGLLGALFRRIFAGFDATARVFQLAAFAIADLLIFFFTVRAAAVRDPLYAERYDRGRQTTRAHLSCMLRSCEVWCDLLLILLSLLIAAPMHPLHAPIQAIAYVTNPPDALFYPFVFAISMPLYAILFFLAHARSRAKLEVLYKKGEQALSRKEARRPDRPLSFFIGCIEPTLILALLAALLPLCYSVILLLVKALGEVTVWLVIGIVTAFLLLFRYTRAIVKRQKFRRELLRVAHETGDEVVFYRPLWISLFAEHDTPDFTIYHKGRRYDGMLLHALRTSTPMIFDGTGVAQVHRIVRLRRVELFRTVTLQRYAFESEGARVLVILPTPKSLSFVGAGGVRDVDVGDRIEGYAVFNATGFLRAIERDCLDHGETLKRH